MHAVHPGSAKSVGLHSESSGRLPGGRPGMVDLMSTRPPSVTPLSQKRRSPTRVICLVRIQTGPYRSVYS